MEMAGDNSPFIFTSQGLLIFTNKKKNLLLSILAYSWKTLWRQKSELIKMLSTKPALHK